MNAVVFKSPFPDVEPPSEYLNSASLFFWRQLDKFHARCLLVDQETGRRWLGAQMKSFASRLAASLIQLAGLAPNDDCLFFYKNNDRIHLAALAVLFAGGSVCMGMADDPENEHLYMVQTLRPAQVFIAAKLLGEMVRIRQQVGHEFKIIIMDDDDEEAGDEAGNQASDKPAAAGNVFKLNGQLLAERAEDTTTSATLPVLVDPDRPAFVLFTSGSTGHPKPVGRSQRNSLYVCFSLAQPAAGALLWDLDAPDCVLAGHLQLDHGTGTFCFKMMLSKGLRLVVMDGYEHARMLRAIHEHRITDVLLGSALLHQLISRENRWRLANHRLDSLRNLLSVGSPLSSHELACEFMRAHAGLSIRQTYGMTECGFLGFVERARAQLPAPQCLEVTLLPNLRVKLLDLESGEDLSPSKDLTNGENGGGGATLAEGELCVGGPTVSPGYLGAQFQRQSKACFLPDGFYKSGDICQVTRARPDLSAEGQDPKGGQEGGRGPSPDQAGGVRLRPRGRRSELLCLYDGWKVLPYEIEQVILRHPAVAEAAVVGVPHPELPTCHAPRAYVVRKRAVGPPKPEHRHANGAASEASNGGLAPSCNGHETTGRRAAATQVEACPDGRAQLTEEELFEFTAGLLSEPKRLTGGIKFLDELPRISLAKVDKKLLKQQDGYC